MIKLILVRHAMTTCNEYGNLSGFTDSILSEKGKVQADKLTDYLKDEHIDEIYTTPFRRTKDTVKNLAKLKKIKITENEKLNEINFGDFEGLDFEIVKKNYPDEFDKMISEEFNYKYPNGESLIDTFNRASKMVDEILESNDNKTVLICSHGGTIRNIVSYMISKDYKYHWNFKIDNASITVFEVDNDFAVLSKLNDTSFI